VLYDGTYDGLFGFYVRASDPRFERRIVRADKLLYQYGPTTTFEWSQSSHVASTDDVVRRVRDDLGCRWVAIEVGRSAGAAVGRRLLRDAVTRPEFVLMQSFPIGGAGAGRRVDVYQLSDQVNSAVTVDLTFPAFDSRVFSRIAPIER
jgi:hypothetical protein